MIGITAQDGFDGCTALIPLGSDDEEAAGRPPAVRGQDPRREPLVRLGRSGSGRKPTPTGFGQNTSVHRGEDGYRHKPGEIVLTPDGTRGRGGEDRYGEAAEQAG